MDAYTHGCILHPELAVDSMIPAYATTRIRSMYYNILIRFHETALVSRRISNQIQIAGFVLQKYNCTVTLQNTELS